MQHYLRQEQRCLSSTMVKSFFLFSSFSAEQSDTIYADDIQQERGENKAIWITEGFITEVFILIRQVLRIILAGREQNNSKNKTEKRRLKTRGEAGWITQMAGGMQEKKVADGLSP